MVKNRQNVNSVSRDVYRADRMSQPRVCQPPMVHPRAYGADWELDSQIRVTKGSSPCIRGRYPTLKKISEVAEQLLPFQNPMTESVCTIFLEYIFADNTFWSQKKQRLRYHTPSAFCFFVVMRLLRIIPKDNHYFSCRLSAICFPRSYPRR